MANDSRITVAAIQSSFTDNGPSNVARMTELVRQAAKRSAQIVLPSELFEGHYFCREQDVRNFRRARPAKGHPTLLHFQNLARELEIVIPVSFFERAGQAYYNSIAIVDADGSLLGVYRKSHIPDGPGYQEKFYFRSGDTGFKVWPTRYCTLGVGICWDQWFPECARAMVLMGADVLLYPTAIGSEPKEPDLDTKELWQRAMIGHAVANVVPVVAANRVGTEGGQTYYGSSFIANHRGDKVSELGRTEAGIAAATLDLEQVRRDRASFGFFRDRRPELYQALLTSDGSTQVSGAMPKPKRSGGARKGTGERPRRQSGRHRNTHARR